MCPPRSMLVAEGEWGSVRWAREGEVETLAAAQAEAAKTAAGSYSMAVEESLQLEEPGATVGGHLRSSWPQVLGCPCRRSPCPLCGGCSSVLPRDFCCE